MSKEQLSDILAELALDPVMFVETMLQVKPEKWQKEFLRLLPIEKGLYLAKRKINQIGNLIMTA